MIWLSPLTSILKILTGIANQSDWRYIPVELMKPNRSLYEIELASDHTPFRKGHRPLLTILSPPS